MQPPDDWSAGKMPATNAKPRSYSRWFREAIRDNQLADAAAAIERDTSLDTKASRARLGVEIERRYTAPARESA